MTRAFLGVERSMTGQRWTDRLDEAGQGRALAIGQTLDVPDVLARVAAGRGQTADTCARFLDPTLRDAMPDPAALAGLTEAVERLALAVERRERVAIFGDYDVDGACSAALLADYLRAAGLDPAVHIPDRITEGYGPNTPAVLALARGGARLLVTVDCGTASIEPLIEAKRAGLDCVVIDHHQAPVALPPAHAIVNPNRQDDLSGLGHLCAAGVVFMVLAGLHRHLRARDFWTGRPAPDLLAALDLVALATVADVMPLVGLNRAFVAKGLAVMRLRARPGLAALFDVAGAAGPPTAFHLGYLIGPRINAGGRVGDAALGARLLSTADPDEARTVAERLDALNRERRAIEADAVLEAEAATLATLGPAGAEGVAALVTSGADWHPGVVGLVAARLRERHDRPAFAISGAGTVGKGSGRSVPGVDLGHAVRLAVERGILVAGGGHAMAAGITIDMAQVEAFRTFLHDHCADTVAARARPALACDALVAASAVTSDLVTLLERAGPFGHGNPDPVLALPAHRLLKVMPVGADHLRMTLAGPDGARIGAVAFRCASEPLGRGLRNAEGGLLHVAGTLAVNHWGGGARVELRLADAAPA